MVFAGTAGTVTLNGTQMLELAIRLDSGTEETVVLDGSGNAILTSPILTETVLIS
jgi:hypothetical protein